MISITWALGFALGSQSYTFQTLFENIGFDPTTALQITLGIFALLSFIFMLMPIIFVDEKKYSEPNVSKEGSFEAVKSVFLNKNFRAFTFSDLTYWLSLTFIQIGISYYVTILLKLPL